MKRINVFEDAGRLEAWNVPHALVTLIGKSGRTPRHDGRMMVLSDGTFTGTIGGGRQEDLARRRAVECIKTGKGGKYRFPVRESGEIEVFIDVIRSERRCVIFGAGHVARSVAEALNFTGFSVTVIDKREDMLTRENFPYAEMKTALDDSVMLNENTAAVIFNPEEAEELVPMLEKTPVRYIGVLSSRRRNLSSDRRVHVPVGLDIGAETPEEIAISVVSEILADFGRKDADPCGSYGRKLVVVRGAGDLATAVIIRLKRAGYSVLALEVDAPTVIRTTVAFAPAVYDGHAAVEGEECVLIHDTDECWEVFDQGKCALMVDPDCRCLEKLRPVALVDAIIAKKNLGTRKDMAPFTVALGPGFEAGRDVDVVVETQRGHDLGRLIWKGMAAPNSGVPGIIGGYGKERVIHSPCSGTVRHAHEIGDLVEKDETVLYIGATPVKTVIAGRLRGLIREGLFVPEHFKIADVDPRGEKASWTTMSDKARAIAGAVLEAVDGSARKA